MKIFSFIFYSFFVALLLAVVGLFFAPQLPIANTIALKIVESGSMEPSIMTGSLVVVRPAATYTEGDVITFESAQASVPTTHRILAVREANGEKFFMTKGDANEEADTDEVALRSILGKVIVSIPYVGFILDFARQPLGFVSLIVVPAALIILGEIEKIWREVRRRRTQKLSKDHDDNEESPIDDIHVVATTTAARVRMIEIACPLYFESPVSLEPQPSMQRERPQSNRPQYVLSSIIVLVSVIFAGMSSTGSTVSYFNDLESALGNFLQASLVDFTAIVESPVHTFDSLEDTVTFTTAITPDPESLLVDYTLEVEKVSGDDVFCSAILVTVSDPIVYSGPLLAMADDGITFDATWDMTLGLDSNVLGYSAPSMCVVNVVYTAWYQDGPAGVGYSDTESVQLTLDTSVGNELLFAPLFELEAFMLSEPPAAEEVTEEKSNGNDAATTELPAEEPVVPPGEDARLEISEAPVSDLGLLEEETPEVEEEVEEEVDEREEVEEEELEPAEDEAEQEEPVEEIAL